MKVQILGGFLGSGKTTLARALAREWRGRGERVAIITNDQGTSLVDTELCRESADDLYEITGGCFCCRYPELEAALLAARDAGATVAIAEAVGSCADLVATVVGPLDDRCQTSLSVEPLAVVVDPWRIHGAATTSLGNDVDFLFRKQIEEADVVLLSRADLGPPDVRTIIAGWNSEVPVLSVSGTTGEGIAEWLALSSTYRSRPLIIDYERYATAESLLGWCNARVQLRSPTGRHASESMRTFLAAMAAFPVAHVKVTSTDLGGASGAVTHQNGDIQLTGALETPGASAVHWLINARVALSPDDLERAVRGAMSSAATGAEVIWEELDCFSPGRPNPTHRYAARCATTADASCCSAFYQRDDVRWLLGGSYHPGGIELTLRMMRAVDLRAGATVLDVACGTGESLRAILEEFSAHGIGVDTAVVSSRDARLERRRGDAHALPCEDASVDIVLCECALSTFVDQPGALREMHRVLRPGGFIAVSDMVLQGDVPESLREWMHSGTCLERALTASAYVTALHDAGFTIVEQWDASDGLRELLTRIKRNLIGWIAAAASGTVTTPLLFDVGAARAALRDAATAVSDGTIRYGVFIGTRATSPG